MWLKAIKSKRLQLLRVLRYACIYGMKRTIVKALSRFGAVPYPAIGRKVPGPTVAIIGCGQFSFSTIGYYIQRHGRLMACFDVNEDRSALFSKFYGTKRCASVDDLFTQSPKIVYIASNHSSHASYAIAAMKAGVREVFIEKPIAVNLNQLVELIAWQKTTGTRLHAGYNRPFSAAVARLRREFHNGGCQNGPFTISCFVSGHQIPKDHWYRLPGEGTRVCGNLGHWIDLTVHLLSWRSVPERIDIQVSYSNPEEADDNFCVTLTTSESDLVVLTLTSRCEPFEGINETINFHHGEIIAKIDDFRRLTIWHSHRLVRKRFWPKDVGHKRGVMQPFAGDVRNWSEVVLSTLLMLFITELVQSRRSNGCFVVSEELRRFEALCKATLDELQNVECRFQVPRLELRDS